MKAIDRMLQVTKLIAESISTELPLQQLRMLLIVMDQEGINQQDFQDLLGVPAGTVSRNLAKLGSKIVEDRDGSRKEVGYGLIDIYPDPTDPKKNTVHLSKNGKGIRENLELIFQGVTPLRKACQNVRVPNSERFDRV